MYFIIIAILLTLGTIFELNNKKSMKYFYYCLLFALTVLLCFRYGQGTDYYAYYKQYQITPQSLNELLEIRKQLHGETGWYILMLLFKNMGFNFEGFIIVLSLFMMYNLNKVIKEYSNLRVCSLLLFFPTYYMTYFSSALRQGLVLCIFLAYGIKLLLSNKKIKFGLLILFLTSFHKSTIILLILPFIPDKFDEKSKIGVYLALIIIFVLGYTGKIGLKPTYFSEVSSYLTISVSIMTVFVRFIYFLIIKLLHDKVSNLNDKNEKKLFNIYEIGFYLYIALSFSSNLSQRLTMPLKALEIIVIPIQILLLANNMPIIKNYKKKPKHKIIKLDKKTLMLFYIITILVIPNIELIKNIDSYLKQGNYNKEIGVFQYPYLNIWNKDEVSKYIYYWDI